jgi:chromosomal replication initiation ATPase DnaA
MTEGNWSYVGRMKFKELLQELKEVRESTKYTALWLYGTQGYGKFHLLAALVCYLAAADERIVYIPGCRAMLNSPVRYIQAAMLFAWADDITTQEY